MGKPTFNFNMGNNDISAKEELAKIETQEFYKFKIIPYDEIETNILNDYPITDIEDLAKSIKKSGLIQPLGVILNKNDEDKSHKKYRLYNGERRYTAIGLILKEEPNHPAFKKGIPCMVENKDLSPIEEEIKLILANKQRDTTEEFRRKKAERLVELYRKIEEETGEKFNITKKVAEDLQIGERQARRYTSLEKLIPELKDAFDSAKFNLENAANIANMDEESQKAILALIQANQQIGKEELALVKTEREALKKELDKVTDQIKKNETENKALRDLLNEKEDAIKKASLDEETLRTQIKSELEKSNPSEDKIEELKNELDRISDKNKRLEEEKKAAQITIKENEKNLSDLKEKLNKSSTNEIPESLKEKLREEAAISSLEKELEKKLKEYSINVNNFKNKYKTQIENDDFIKKVTHITKSLSNITGI